MSHTRITDPAAVHAGIAGGLADAAAMLTNHPTLPGISRCDIGWRHDEDLPSISAWIHPTTGELNALLQWVDATNAQRVIARRYIAPHAFTVLALHCEHGASLVEVSTQPAEKELAALWHATGQEPEPAVTATISIEALRAAAASFESTSDDAEVAA